MKNTLLVISILFITGCATTANYEKILDSWVGSDADRLASSWGPPANVYEMQSGKLLTYMTDHGASSYVTHGKYSSFVTTTANYCKTTFEVDSSNVIRRWKWEGNTCKAKAPKD